MRPMCREIVEGCHEEGSVILKRFADIELIWGHSSGTFRVRTKDELWPMRDLWIEAHEDWKEAVDEASKEFVK